MSTTFLPFVRVAVASPVDREPPAIPIFAVFFVAETRRKTGSDAGKVLPMSTSSLLPLIEIRAPVGAKAGGGGGAGVVVFFAGWAFFGAVAGVAVAATHAGASDEGGLESQVLASTC